MVFINLRSVQIEAFNDICIYIKTTATMSFKSCMILIQSLGVPNSTFLDLAIKGLQ